MITCLYTTAFKYHELCTLDLYTPQQCNNMSQAVSNTNVQNCSRVMLTQVESRLTRHSRASLLADQQIAWCRLATDLTVSQEVYVVLLRLNIPIFDSMLPHSVVE